MQSSVLDTQNTERGINGVLVLMESIEGKQRKLEI